MLGHPVLHGLDNKHAKLVLKCNTMKKMWERLSEMHENNSNNSKVTLKKKFFGDRKQ